MQKATSPDTDLKQPLRSWLSQLRKGYSVNQAIQVLENANSGTDWPAYSRSHNGYVRELAVRVLAHRRSLDALHALLVCANDWVPSIREQALQGIEFYLDEEQVFLLLQNLPRLLALSRQQRGDHRPLLHRVQSLLALPQHEAEVKAAWSTLRGQASHFLFGLLVDGEGAPKLLEQALRHPDPVVRTLALDAGKKLPTSARQQLLLGAMTNRSTMVRSKALRLLLREVMPHREALESGLLDRSTSVRSIALWHAQRVGVDPKLVLEQRLFAAMPACTSQWLGVLGLSAALGKLIPAPWLDTALRSDSTRIRLAGIAQLDDEAVSSFIRQLDHASPKVFRGALSRLRKLPWHALQLPVSRYIDQHWQTMETSRRDELFNLLAYWQRIAYLLRKMEEAQDSTYWQGELRTWSYQRHPSLDSLTPQEERHVLSERIKQLAATGQLPKGCLTCIK